MNLGIAILSVGAAYLIGSLSFARLVTKWWAFGKSITEHEIAVETDEQATVGTKANRGGHRSLIAVGRRVMPADRS